MAPGPRNNLTSEVGFRLVVRIALLTQLGVTISLMLSTDKWATLLGSQCDSEQLMLSGGDVLLWATSFIGVIFLVKALPDLISECLAILHPEAKPVS